MAGQVEELQTELDAAKARLEEEKAKRQKLLEDAAAKQKEFEDMSSQVHGRRGAGRVSGVLQNCRVLSVFQFLWAMSERVSGSAGS